MWHVACGMWHVACGMWLVGTSMEFWLLMYLFGVVALVAGAARFCVFGQLAL